MTNPLDHSRPGLAVLLELDEFQAQALRSAAEYLAGFGRVLAAVEDDTQSVSDLSLVLRTLGELHLRASEGLHAA